MDDMYHPDSILRRNPNGLRGTHRLRTSRYFNSPPTGGWVVDAEDNYSFDDISSSVLYSLVTDFTKEVMKQNQTDSRRSKIRSLESIKIKKLSSDKVSETCSICIETFENDQPDSYCRELNCKHVFHKRCIDRWLKKSDLCPMCKTTVIK